jgi:hypothetical protein
MRENVMSASELPALPITLFAGLSDLSEFLAVRQGPMALEAVAVGTAVLTLMLLERLLAKEAFHV